jgi:hypothetical protein
MARTWMPVGSSTVRIENMKAAPGRAKAATIPRMTALPMVPSSLRRFTTTP